MLNIFNKSNKNDYKCLKRTDFINSVDSNKIWNKSMTISEIKLLLEHLENELSKYEFDEDKNFIMNQRRKGLKEEIEERFKKNDGNMNNIVSESLFNFWEFVSDEYGGVLSILEDYKELDLSIDELSAMDDEYRNRGIICFQEKNIILEMINSFKIYINENR